MKRIILTIGLSVATMFMTAQTTVRYVTPYGNGSGTGSWSNASNDLQLMINNSSPGDEIWVAQGMYRPERSANNLGIISIGDENNAFVLKKDVKIFGGFPNNGIATWTDRDWETYKSILDAQVAGSGVNSVYSYHVVISAGDVGESCLDGFTIRNGNAFPDNSVQQLSISVNGKWVSKLYGGGIVIEFKLI